MKALALLFLALALMGASCQTIKQPVIVDKNRVWRIPDEFLVCTQVMFPKAETLTDKQVAKLIVALHRENLKCHLNMETIRRLQAHAIATIEGGGPVFDAAP